MITDKELLFKKELKKYGVTKCNISGVDFTSNDIIGKVFVNIDNEELIKDLKNFVSDNLIIEYNDFSNLEPNYVIDISRKERELYFREILKKYGVTKCYLDEYFTFENEYPSGTIYLNVVNASLVMELYKLFTKDEDGFVEDNQCLFINDNDFNKIQPNYNLEV